MNDSTISSGTPTALLTNVKAGTTFTITNAAEDDHGTMYDVKITVTAIDRSNLKPGTETDDKSVNLVVGYENGSGKHRGILFDYMNANDITISATFLDKSGNPVRPCRHSQLAMWISTSHLRLTLTRATLVL